MHHYPAWHSRPSQWAQSIPIIAQSGSIHPGIQPSSLGVARTTTFAASRLSRQLQLIHTIALRASKTGPVAGALARRNGAAGSMAKVALAGRAEDVQQSAQLRHHLIARLALRIGWWGGV